MRAFPFFFRERPILNRKRSVYSIKFYASTVIVYVVVTPAKVTVTVCVPTSFAVKVYPS